MGLNPNRAQVGDLAIHVSHNGLYTRFANGWKLELESKVGLLSPIDRLYVILFPYLFNSISIGVHEKVNIVPRVGGLCAPIAAIAQHHKMWLLFPIVDEFFVIGDKVVKVEHTNIESRTLVWKLWRYSKGK